MPRPRLIIIGAVVALGMAVAPSAMAATITIPAQGGNDQETVTPGTTIVAGYDFTYVAGATTLVKNASLVLDLSCATSGVTASPSSVTITFPDTTYDGSQNSQGWVPSGDQSSPLTYQGSTTVPNACNGGNVIVAKPNMGPFVADVSSTDTSKSLSFRFHHGLPSNESTNGGTGTSWSATKSVTPDPLSGVASAPLLGRSQLLILVAAFLVAAGATATTMVRRRRVAA